MSSRSVVGMPERSMAAPTATLASSKASTSTSEPLWARPIGVRAPATMTASVTVSSFRIDRGDQRADVVDLAGGPQNTDDARDRRLALVLYPLGLDNVESPAPRRRRPPL